MEVKVAVAKAVAMGAVVMVAVEGVGLKEEMMEAEMVALAVLQRR